MTSLTKKNRKKPFSLSIIGIANSVELFKGEIGKGGSISATRQGQKEESKDS